MGGTISLREHLLTEQVVIGQRNLLESYGYRGRVAQLGEHLFCK